VSEALDFEPASELVEIVRPALLAVDRVRVVDREPRMDEPIAETMERLRRAANDLEPLIAASRRMYRALGIDPTKTRPSSEALLRRVRKGEPLPRINSLVDICNWSSIETQMPFGLYDRGRIEGDVVRLRLGRDGEGYDGIRKDRVNVAGRLALVDAIGPFGNPTSDSSRTMVTLATTRVLFVIYAPVDSDDAAIEHALTLTLARVDAYARA
jgi:DNA/RNA-binding domain of Phe-tRNA-synthetase-like protein